MLVSGRLSVPRLSSLVAIATLSLAGACTTPRGPAHVLPLKQLRLYETGVGYFERSGPLPPRARASVPVPAGHIDDALKTLTVASEGGQARISGVAFPSNLSGGMARALAGLAPTGKGPIAFRDVLSGLRGQPVELDLIDEGSLKGTIVNLRREKRSSAPTPEAKGTSKAPKTPAAPRMVEHLLILDESGTVRSLPLSSVRSVRPSSPALRQRLRTALTALTKRGRQKKRALELLASARGPVTIGYIAETPLYRVSYRLVAGDKGQPSVLQGWTLVHNDSDEDWRQVKLSLVSGRPDSFLFPLTVPRYRRRPLVHPKQALPSVPQLINTTPDALWGDQLQGESDDGSYGLGGLGAVGGGRGGGGGSGSGYGYGKTGRRGRFASSALRVGNLAAFSKAKARKAGVLFHYRMASPINLRAHSSALLPFTQIAISRKRITLFATTRSAARAATLLENSSPQTLPAGTIAFYAGGTFAGESFLPRSKPGQRHFLQHGTDLDVELEVLEDRSKERFVKLEASPSSLTEHFLRTRTLKVALRNRDSEAREVYLGLQVVKNGKVSGADALDYVRAKGRAYAILRATPGKRGVRTLTIVEGLSRFHHPQSASLEGLRKLMKEPKLQARWRKPLAEILTKRAALKALGRARHKLRNDTRDNQRELRRLRRHLQALGAKAGAAAAPLVKRILVAEDEHKRLRAEGNKQRSQRRALREALSALLRKLRGQG